MWTENKEKLFAKLEATLTGKIRIMLEKTGTAFEEERLTFDGSHTAILIVPWDEKNDVHAGELYYIRLTIHYISTRVGNIAFNQHRVKAITLYKTLLGLPAARPFAGWIFEGLIHARLRSGGQFSTNCCGSNRTETFELADSQDTATFNGLSALSTLLRKEKYTLRRSIQTLQVFIFSRSSELSGSRRSRAFAGNSIRHGSLENCTFPDDIDIKSKHPH